MTDTSKDSNSDNNNESTIEKSPLTGVALVNAVRKQVEFYFSKENLQHDPFLTSQMDAHMSVPIATVMKFAKMKALTQDESVLRQAVEGSTLSIVGDQNDRIKANLKPTGRSTIILREIPSDAPKEEVEAIFQFEGCRKISSIKSDVGDTWFVVMDNENDAKDTILDLRIKKRMFRGASIKARLKTETVVRSFYPLQTPAPAINPYGQVPMMPNMQFGNTPNAAMRGPGNNTASAATGTVPMQAMPYAIMPNGMAIPAGMMPAMMPGAGGFMPNPVGGSGGVPQQQMYQMAQQVVYDAAGAAVDFSAVGGKGSSPGQYGYSPQQQNSNGGGSGKGKGKGGKSGNTGSGTGEGHKRRGGNDNSGAGKSASGGKSGGRGGGSDNHKKNDSGHHAHQSQHDNSGGKHGHHGKAAHKAPTIEIDATNFPPLMGVEDTPIPAAGYQGSYLKYTFDDIVQIVRTKVQNVALPPEIKPEQHPVAMTTEPNKDLVRRQRSFSIDETREQLRQGKPVLKDAVLPGKVDSKSLMLGDHVHTTTTAAPESNPVVVKTEDTAAPVIDTPSEDVAPGPASGTQKITPSTWAAMLKSNSGNDSGTAGHMAAAVVVTPQKPKSHPQKTHTTSAQTGTNKGEKSSAEKGSGNRGDGKERKSGGRRNRGGHNKSSSKDDAGRGSEPSSPNRPDNASARRGGGYQSDTAVAKVAATLESASVDKPKSGKSDPSSEAPTGGGWGGKASFANILKQSSGPDAAESAVAAPDSNKNKDTKNKDRIESNRRGANNSGSSSNNNNNSNNRKNNNSNAEAGVWTKEVLPPVPPN